MEFKIVTEALKANNVHFHSKAPKEEKVSWWLLKGLSRDCDEEEVKNVFNKFKFKKVKIISIKKINMKTFFRAKSGREVFLIKVSGDSDSAELTSVT